MAHVPNMVHPATGLLCFSVTGTEVAAMGDGADRSSAGEKYDA